MRYRNPYFLFMALSTVAVLGWSVWLIGRGRGPFGGDRMSRTKAVAGYRPLHHK